MPENRPTQPQPEQRVAALIRELIQVREKQRPPETVTGYRLFDSGTFLLTQGIFAGLHVPIGPPGRLQNHPLEAGSIQRPGSFGIEPVGTALAFIDEVTRATIGTAREMPSPFMYDTDSMARFYSRLLIETVFNSHLKNTRSISELLVTASVKILGEGGWYSQLKVAPQVMQEYVQNTAIPLVLKMYDSIPHEQRNQISEVSNSISPKLVEYVTRIFTELSSDTPGSVTRVTDLLRSLEDGTWIIRLRRDEHLLKSTSYTNFDVTAAMPQRLKYSTDEKDETGDVTHRPEPLLDKLYEITKGTERGNSEILLSALAGAHVDSIKDSMEVIESLYSIHFGTSLREHFTLDAQEQARRCDVILGRVHRLDLAEIQFETDNKALLAISRLKRQGDGQLSMQDINKRIKSLGINKSMLLSAFVHRNGVLEIMNPYQNRTCVIDYMGQQYAVKYYDAASKQYLKAPEILAILDQMRKERMRLGTVEEQGIASSQEAVNRVLNELSGDLRKTELLRNRPALREYVGQFFKDRFKRAATATAVEPENLALDLIVDSLIQISRADFCLAIESQPTTTVDEIANRTVLLGNGNSKISVKYEGSASNIPVEIVHTTPHLIFDGGNNAEKLTSLVEHAAASITQEAQIIRKNKLADESAKPFLDSIPTGPIPTQLDYDKNTGVQRLYLGEASAIFPANSILTQETVYKEEATIPSEFMHKSEWTDKAVFASAKETKKVFVDSVLRELNELIAKQSADIEAILNKTREGFDSAEMSKLIDEGKNVLEQLMILESRDELTAAADKIWDRYLKENPDFAQKSEATQARVRNKLSERIANQVQKIISKKKREGIDFLDSNKKFIEKSSKNLLAYSKELTANIAEQSRIETSQATAKKKLADMRLEYVSLPDAQQGWLGKLRTSPKQQLLEKIQKLEEAVFAVDRRASQLSARETWLRENFDKTAERRQDAIQTVGTVIKKVYRDIVGDPNKQRPDGTSESPILRTIEELNLGEMSTFCLASIGLICDEIAQGAPPTLLLPVDLPNGRLEYMNLAADVEFAKAFTDFAAICDTKGAIDVEQFMNARAYLLQRFMVLAINYQTQVKLASRGVSNISAVTAGTGWVRELLLEQMVKFLNPRIFVQYRPERMLSATHSNGDATGSSTGLNTVLTNGIFEAIGMTFIHGSQERVKMSVRTRVDKKKVRERAKQLAVIRTNNPAAKPTNAEIVEATNELRNESERIHADKELWMNFAFQFPKWSSETDTLLLRAIGRTWNENVAEQPSDISFFDFMMMRMTNHHLVTEPEKVVMVDKPSEPVAVPKPTESQILEAQKVTDQLARYDAAKLAERPTYSKAAAKMLGKQKGK